MNGSKTSRRAFLRGTAAAAAIAAVPTAAQAADHWEAVETPTENTVYDVAYTSDGAFAVAGGGIVLERTDDGWEKVIDGGPTGNDNDLYGAGVTGAGGSLWFVGASGAIGEFDLSRRVVEDYSAPNDVTNNFNDVAVTGVRGSASVYVAGDSGKIYYSFDDGDTFDEVTPGSGSAVHAVDFHDGRSGHAVDGNQTVFETTDGSTYERVGIADANANFFGVDSDATDDVWVSGGGGMIHHWDGTEWTPTDTGDATLRDIEVPDHTAGLSVGGGGVVFARDEDGWTEETTPTGENLKAVVRGGTDIAVGAAGTIIER